MNRIPSSRISSSLTGKIIIAIGIVIILGDVISWYALVSTEKKQLVNDAVENAASFSDLIRRGIRHSMLTIHRDSIQQTIESIGSREDIKQIKIFDGAGKILYSSKHAEIGHRVDKASDACAGCHSGAGKPLTSLTNRNQWSIYSDKEGLRLLTFVEPIYNEPSCYTASCHAHPESQKVLGILKTDFSLVSVDSEIKKHTAIITAYAAVFIFISSVILYFVLRRLLLKPVSTLSKAMEKVAAGDLSQTVPVTSRDEMGMLTNAFNVMTNELKTAKEKIDNWAQALEGEIEKKTEELKKSQSKLIQAEKLAALGRLTSDVAHEIRNPLTAVGGFARRLNKIITGEKEKEYAEVLISEVDKLEKILRNILTFSRDARFNLEKNNLGEIIRDTLKTYEELCAENSIKLKVETEEDLPSILIDRGQVRQALSNLITNAVDAMSGGGTLSATAGQEKLHGVTFVYLKVIDTGKGIPEDKLPLIFEPFFSTKEVGRGTGLGLSITRKIIEEHGGFIKAESVQGKGSTFSLYFPYQSEEDALKVKCWEYMKCGRDKDGAVKCPAYPNYGRVCWAVAGTFCEGKIQGTFAQKYENCRKCEFYRETARNEI